MENTVSEIIISLIDEELKTVNEKLGIDSEDMEIYNALNEGIEEAKDRVIEINEKAYELWKEIRGKESDEAIRKRYTQIWARATRLAIVAVQIAAAARKGITANIKLTDAAAGQEARADAAQPLLNNGA